ncbi:MAG: carboxypeptidase regulatory-like domain-containing protein [Flavobacteriales bacterium]|nr:carboxypeptidase regulatory-like domain-containing protein [Flavobacteriales bacterium]
MKRLGLILLSTLFVVSFSFAQQNEGILKGSVNNKSKAVLSDAVIVITSKCDSSFVRKITTDQAGQFIFKNLRPAKYNVRIWHAGYKEFTKSNVKLKFGRIKVVNVKLKSSPPVYLGVP